jgi:hypothetical protein
LGDASGCAMVLQDQARLAQDAGDLERATALVEESLALAREVGDRLCIACGLTDLAHHAMLSDEFDRARSLCQESLTLVQQAQSDAWAAYGLHIIGTTSAMVGDYAQGAALLGEASTLYGALGNRTEASHMLGLQAWAEACNGRYELAVTLAEQCLAEKQAVGDPSWIAWGHMMLGVILCAAGNMQPARAHLLESMGRFRGERESGKRALSVSFALFRLGLIAAAERSWGPAVRLLSACEATRSLSLALLAPCEHAARDAALAEARAALGDEAYEAAWAEDAVPNIDAAIDFALAT